MSSCQEKNREKTWKDGTACNMEGEIVLKKTMVGNYTLDEGTTGQSFLEAYAKPKVVVLLLTCHLIATSVFPTKNKQREVNCSYHGRNIFSFQKRQVSHPVFERIPSANYMCAQDVHTTYIATNMENIKNNALLYIETQLQQDLHLLQSIAETTLNLLFGSPYSIGMVDWGKHLPSTHGLHKKLFT